LEILAMMDSQEDQDLQVNPVQGVNRVAEEARVCRECRVLLVDKDLKDQKEPLVHWVNQEE